MFRGHGMVVQLKSLAGTCLGARPFHALLLCGRASEFVAPDVARSNPQADQAAEMFLRTAEPPSHNQWVATPDLKAVYARGVLPGSRLFWTPHRTLSGTWLSRFRRILGTGRTH